jgi:hypothetical protein
MLDVGDAFWILATLGMTLWCLAWAMGQKPRRTARSRSTAPSAGRPGLARAPLSPQHPDPAVTYVGAIPVRGSLAPPKL